MTFVVYIYTTNGCSHSIAFLSLFGCWAAWNAFCFLSACRQCIAQFIEPVYANRVEPRSVQQHAEHLTVQQSCTTQWDTERKKKCRLSHPMSTGCSLDSGQPLHQSRPTTPAGNQAALLVCNRSRHRTEPSVAGRERQACRQARTHAGSRG